MNSAERTTDEAVAFVRVPALTFARMMDRVLDGAPTNPTARRLAQLREQPLTRIGAKGLHGIYAGIARGVDGDHILEVLDEAPKALPWKEALEWAKSVGGQLPTRKEQALMLANVPELFQQIAYWSSEQSASDAECAWFQSFNYGNQSYTHKSAELRARAVRRLILE